MRLIDGAELLRDFSISPSGQRYKLRDCDNFYVDVHLEEVQKRIIKRSEKELFDRTSWARREPYGLDESNA